MADPVLDALLASIENRDAVALLTVTSAEGEYEATLGRHCVLWPDPSRAIVGDLGLPGLADEIADAARDALAARQHRHLTYDTDHGVIKIFVEVQSQPPHLIIVGAGHIAVPLAAIARTCDFEVTVLDDRVQYAHTARFPTATRVIAGPFRAELQRLRAEAHGFDQHTYIVLVTRGHQHDIDCLLEVMDDPLAYVGMIGSQRRIRAVFELLAREQGIPTQRFDRVFAPIGLDIGARTPAEIAVCIMAEIINVMRAGPADSLSDKMRRERLDRRERVAARPHRDSRVSIHMDDSTTLAELRTLVAAFVAARDWNRFHTPKNLAMSIAIEAAELMEHFQWLTVEEAQTHVANPAQRAMVADELADVLIYCLSFANAASIDVAGAIHAKMARNEGRFPVAGT